MKIVLDTNIVVGACLGSYPANRILAACLHNKFKPLMSAALLAEYEDLINRDDVFQNSRLNRDERNELLNALLSVCQWTSIYYLWRPNLRDEADNHLLELAIAGHAQYLITRNLRDFTHAQLLFPHLNICLPETFLEQHNDHHDHTFER